MAMSLESIASEIDRERQRREASADEDPIALIRKGQGHEALENFLFFTPPGDFLSRVDQLRTQLKARFDGSNEDLQISYLRFLVDLSLGLGSFLPRWNLQNAERHGETILTDAEIEREAEKIGDLAINLSTQAPAVADKLLSALRAETTARFEAERAQDPAVEATAKVGNSIGEYLDSVRADIASSNLRRIAEMRAKGRTPTDLGNDYARFLQYAMYVGASFVTTNPVLADIAWKSDPARWDRVVDDIIADNPGADADKAPSEWRHPSDTLVRLLTMEIVLDNMRRLRPIFLLTQGLTGYVCLQVNPREHGDADAMVPYALSTYEDMRAKLDGGIPNVVFKLPGTRAGLEACSVLTKRGIGCTITVNFGLFQHLPFAQVISEGKALTSYLVEMNGRLAYPVRDELLARLDELADYGIDEAEAREAAAWAGVAVLKRLYKLLTKRGYDLTRVRPLVASLRIYEGDGYENLPSSFPDITETLGTGVISVFPNVRRAFDRVPEIELKPRQVVEEVPDGILEVLSHSEIFRQAYYVADRGWLPEEDERFRPIYELTLEDEAGTFSWAPIHHTLMQFIDSYDTLVRRVLERKQLK
jgi:transaldolase